MITTSGDWKGKFRKWFSLENGSFLISHLAIKGIVIYKRASTVKVFQPLVEKLEFNLFLFLFYFCCVYVCLCLCVCGLGCDVRGN